MPRRFAGTVLALVLARTMVISALPAEWELGASTNRIGRYERIEFTLGGPELFSGDALETSTNLLVEILTPARQQVTVPAFRTQDYRRERLSDGRDWIYPVGLPLWKARFAPEEIGTYQAHARRSDAAGPTRSTRVVFESVASHRSGFLRISRRDARFLETSDGNPFFAIGQNLAYIGSQQTVTLSRAESIFHQLGTNGANYVRVWTGCDDWALGLETRKSAWGRSWDWHPPFASCPDNPERPAVCLTADRPGVEVKPSHPVALRPATRYVLAGRAWREKEAALRALILNRPRTLLGVANGIDGWVIFRHEWTSGPTDRWLGNPRLERIGSGTVWLSDLSLREADGGPELLWEAAIERPARGFVNPLDAYMLDELLAAAEREGVRLQLCLLARDLYRGDLKDPASAEYDRALADAATFFRYAVARWGASTSVAAWEYWNEQDPALPTDRFYAELGAWLAANDPYHHLRTTSTWGPSAKDGRHPQLDIADVHFYLRPADRDRLDNEVDAVLERTQWLLQNATNRPVHLGELGLADNEWRITDEMKRVRSLVDVQNVLWASALSGAAGTALPWWWERLDERDGYPLYRPLSRFIAEVPWNGGELHSLTGRCSDPTIRAVGLRAGERAWLWLFDPAAAWKHRVTAGQDPPTRTNITLDLDGWTHAESHVVWWNTTTGEKTGTNTVRIVDQVLHVPVPEFTGTIAGQFGL